MLIFVVKNFALKGKKKKHKNSFFFFLLRKLGPIKKREKSKHNGIKAKVYKENAHSVHRKLIS